MARLVWELTIAAGIIALCPFGGHAAAQQPVDSSVQSSPLKPPPPAPAVDTSVEASPVTGGPSTEAGAHIATGATVALRLTEAANSASLKNGDTLAASLTAAVRLSNGRSLPAGTKVSLNVVETVPAGKMASGGDLVLQVVRVGSVSVVTETQEFEGKPGHKDLPDSAPDKGTEAELHAGATLTFHVQPGPKM
jgi:hypothetical protein